MAVDTSGHILAINARMASMFGYTQQELIGTTYEVLIPKRFQQHHAQLSKWFTNGSRTRPMRIGREVFGVHKNGREFPLEVGLIYIKTSDGDLIVASVVDISEQKRFEEKNASLVHAKASLRAYDHLGLAAAAVQNDGRLLSENQRFEKIRSQFLVQSERLEFLNSTVNKRFIQALNILKGAVDESAKPQFTVPASDGQMPAIVRLMPVLLTEAGSQASALIVLTLKPVGAIYLPSVDVLTEAFGFTLAEAKVAAHCAAGFRVRQTAERLGLSKETVRSQLARIFAKAGVSSQIQLAVLLSTLFTF
jgi:PAS domain S-box-containing protein